MVDDGNEIDDPRSQLPGEHEPMVIGPPGDTDGAGDAVGGVPVWTATYTGPVEGLGSHGPTSEPRLEPERPNRRRNVALVALVGLLLLGASGLIGWLLGRSQPSNQSDTTEVATDAEPTGEEVIPATDEQTAADEDNDRADAVTSTTLPADGQNPTTVQPTSLTTVSEPLVITATPDNPSGVAQYAVMAEGKAIMRGWYPTLEQAAQAVQDATTIMGPGNVVDETQVDERAVIDPTSFAVYFEDYILFESDSATITPEFFTLLSYPLIFMQQGPHAKVTVVARTDARGTTAYNLDLARRRAEAVRDHWLANGGNVDQIILDPRGEEGAEEGVDENQASQDRRVELIVSGFLATE